MIYLDYQATTPVAPEAAHAMLPFLRDNFANPHSPSRLGRAAAAAVEVAREQVMAALGPGTDEGRVHFTSGATEAVNWAVKGAMAHGPGGRNRVVTVTTEHACVLDSVRALAARGFEVVELPVERDGLLDPDRLRAMTDKRTALVAVMLVNNEIGVVQPVAELAKIARGAGALFHCDAVQGLGRVALPVEACDLVSVSAHKVHGPKGVGALWVRDGVTLDPLLHGGGQEGGARSGTLSPMLCAGFGAAVAMLRERGEADRAHVERLWAVAVDALPSWTINGSVEHRYRGNLSIRREGLDAARLLSELRGVALSLGSACASGSGRPSHVLQAIGLDERLARSTVRLGFGRYTTEEEFREALALINEAAARQGV